MHIYFSFFYTTDPNKYSQMKLTKFHFANFWDKNWEGKYGTLRIAPLS